MSLAAVKSRITALQKRLNVMDGAGKSEEVIWSVKHLDGSKTIHSGNPHSRAKRIVEICADEKDAADSRPRIYFDGVEQSSLYDTPPPVITIDAVLSHDTDT